MLEVAAGVDLEALSFLSSLTIFILGVTLRCLGLVQLSLRTIFSLRGSQMGTRGFQDASSLRTQLAPVCN